MIKCFRNAVVVNKVVSDGLLRNLDRTRSIVSGFKKGAVGFMTTSVRQSIAFAKSYKIVRRDRPRCQVCRPQVDLNTDRFRDRRNLGAFGVDVNAINRRRT